MFSDTHVKMLEKILGKKNVLTSKEDLLIYSYDATRHRHLPDVVVKPTSKEEISKVLSFANEEKIPVVPRGAGTNVSGGTIPLLGGIVVVMTGLNRILEIDPENLTATVEPGVVNAHLQKALFPYGLFYPPDPASFQVSTLGGNVAVGSGGPRGIKYGVTKDYVLGLEIALPSGEIIQTGGKTVKNVTGYDLTSLFTGSEGTLGIITGITLRLLRLPRAKKTILAFFEDLEMAGFAVSKIVERGIVPAALEIMDNLTLRCVKDYVRINLPTEAMALLLIEVDGHPGAVEEEGEEILELCKGLRAFEVKISRDLKESEELWTARRSAFVALAKRRPTVITEDATVPRSKVPDMIRRIQEISRKYSVEICVFGHAGDGNLHPIILTDERDQEEMERVKGAIGEIMEAAVKMGGTLSGEHGIGMDKKEFIKLEMSPGAIEVMKKIKKALDPNNIMNPCKIWE